MNRDQAKEYIKRNVLCTDYLTPAPDYRRHGNGNANGLCCPACGSGTHRGNKSTGAVEYYANTNTWRCHICKKSRDVIDAYQLQYNCDYNTALLSLAAQAGIEIDSRPTAADDFTEAAGRPQSAGNANKDKSSASIGNDPQNGNNSPADYSEYYKYCRDNLRSAAEISHILPDPCPILYLEQRGISLETAELYGVGYDPAADPSNVPGAMGDTYKPYPTPRIIIPTSAGHYVGRRIDGRKEYDKVNAKGSTPALFNAEALHCGADVVFVTEGAFDALSFLEASINGDDYDTRDKYNYTAVALNSKSNDSLLTDALREQGTTSAFVIVPDNDSEPNTAADTMKRAEQLRDDLRALGLRAIVYNVAGKYHDANDALQAGRAEFEQGIAAAIEELRQEYLPAGTLTYEKALAIFETANDEFVTMPKFPEFCKRAKIKLHDSVVLAADTGAGKSSLAINFIDNLNDDYPVMYFNLEMDELTILRRLVSIRTGIELDRIEGYKHDERTAAAVNTALREITSRKPLQIIQDKYNIKDIEAEIKQTTAGRDDPTIVVIDHSLLVTTKESYSRYERFTQISEELRRIARLNNVIMFVLLQQNRDGKSDDNKRPTNSSLKESGSWENDATHILFLWYDPQARTKKIIMTKNRSGAPGEFSLEYYPTTQYYKESRDQTSNTDTATNARQNKRNRERDQLQAWYEEAYTKTGGNVTLYDMAEAAGTTTAVIKRRLKEYGGYIVEGEQYDAAGMDTDIEQAQFIRMTIGEAPAFDDDAPAWAGSNIVKKF